MLIHNSVLSITMHYQETELQTSVNMQISTEVNWYTMMRLILIDVYCNLNLFMSELILCINTIITVTVD